MNCGVVYVDDVTSVGDVVACVGVNMLLEVVVSISDVLL